MTMLPNYIIAVLAVLFLIRSFILMHIKKAQISNVLTFGISIILAILLLGMSIYGIVFQIPLGQVQSLIESSF